MASHETRAGSTRLDASELAAVAAEFDLGTVQGSERVLAGTINTNYRLETEKGRFFLRVNEGKSDADVDYEARLITEIAGRGVPTPVPLCTGNGDRFASGAAGKQLSAFPWVAGVHVDGTGLVSAHLSSLGSAMARLHQATETLGSQFRRNGIYTTDAIAERARGIDVGDDAELSAALSLVFRALAALDAKRSERSALPQTVIHGDLFPDNVLFDGTAVVALLDFEQASSGAPLYDLAVCLNAWCIRDGALDSSLAAALLNGYRDVRALPELTAEALWTECIAAAVRFTVTRITDVYLRGLERAGKGYRDFLARMELWTQIGSKPLEALV